MFHSKGKRDHAKSRIFLHENSVSMANIPLNELNQMWLKEHLLSLKKSVDGKR
eukprot:UN18049